MHVRLQKVKRTYLGRPRYIRFWHESGHRVVYETSRLEAPGWTGWARPSTCPAASDEALHKGVGGEAVANRQDPHH